MIAELEHDDKTFYVVITRGAVGRHEAKRMFKAFAHHRLSLIILGDQDISKIGNWIDNGKPNEALMYLYLILDRSTLPEQDRVRMSKKGNLEIRTMEVRLEHMEDFKSNQPRTTLKKLRYLMAETLARFNISDACKYAKVSRQAFYKWKREDPVFTKLRSIQPKITNYLNMYA